MSTPLRIFCVVGLLTFAGPICPPPAQSAEVVIVKTKKFPLHDQAADGFLQQFKGSTAILVMEGDFADPRVLLNAISNEKPRVIVAIGLKAAKVLKSEIQNIPIVFCMAISSAQLKAFSASNVTGVDLEPSPAEQLKAFRSALPSIKRIGIIYDPKRSKDFVDSLEKATREQGIGLMARAVSERREVPGALGEVIGQAQALWLIRDATVMTKEFFNHTLIIQFEKKIALLAYSEQFVHKGALASFSASYRAQGKRAAEMVQSILQGAVPSNLPMQTPEGKLSLNINSAEKAGIKIPPSILKQPDVEMVKGSALGQDDAQPGDD